MTADEAHGLNRKRPAALTETPPPANAGGDVFFLLSGQAATRLRFFEAHDTFWNWAI
jgi:hypothetical protein